MTMHACERARARYLNDRVRCKMSTVAPNLNGLTQCPVECATLRCTCSGAFPVWCTPGSGRSS